jgi:2-polyprenyl-3-methyl-5-hydroxy-6-metoxy-1,4-benzoquinol methylase
VEHGATGLLLDEPSSIEPVVEALLRVIEYPKEYHAMRQAAWHKARQRFTKERFKCKVLGRVTEVLPGKSSPAGYEGLGSARVSESRSDNSTREAADRLAMLHDMKHDELYSSYVGFKSWEISHDESSDLEYSGEAYEIEILRSGVVPPARILEIGFGTGRFLDWATRRGYSVTGVEIIEELVERARVAGHNVFQGTVQSAINPDNHQFDLIVAFDVFEHLTVEQLISLFKFSHSILSDKGKILARFPNGGSPFGSLWQNSDLTHITTLSAERIRQIALMAGMRVLSVKNAARPLGGRRSSTLKYGAYKLRDIIEWTVGHLYFGYRVPLDPNLTVLIGMERCIAP